MKKSFKRWLALLLAVIMVASTGLSHADGFLKATEGDVTEVTEGTEELVIADETVEGEEVEPVEDVQTLEVPKNPEEVTEQSQEPEASQPTETPETPQAPEAQEEPVETPEKITYQVVFNEPKLSGGTISVWAEGEEKQAVSYNNGKFTKEVKEGDTLYFEITNADNYTVEKVTDQAGEALKSEKTAEKTSTYKMVVKAQNEITVVYQEVKSNTAAADGETTESKQEKPITFNAQEESDRLLGEDRAETEYPEYLTVGFSQENPGIAGLFHYADQANPNGNCIEWAPGYENPKEHYVILKYTNDVKALAYVRCDVWQALNNKPDADRVTYLVEYRDESNKLIYSEPVNENTKPQNVPTNLGIGYWTLSGDTKHVEPSDYTIAKPTTFVWHESANATITYYKNTTDGVENLPASSTIDAGSEYTIASEIPLREGYKFEGWTLSEKGNERVYQPGEKYKVEKDRTTFYAKWERMYKITAESDENSHITELTWVEKGENVKIGYSANPGYEISEVSVDKQKINLTEGNNKEFYTFENVQKDHTISIKSKETEQGVSYPVYYYTLVPGKDLDSQEKPDVKWNGMGIGSIQGVKSPSEYKINDRVEEGIHTPPANGYPSIQMGDRVYQYTEKGSSNASKAGYYTVEWIRTIVENGANAGANNHNQPVIASGNTFHRDGIATLIDRDRVNVHFYIQEPNESEFALCEGYAHFVEKGTLEADLTRPQTPAKEAGGKTWKFDGWYKNEACTKKTEFNGKLTEDTNYYGKYVLDEDTLSYNGNGATSGTTAPTVGKVGGKVTVATNGFVKDGYTFTGWNTEADGTGILYEAGSEYTLTAGEDVLYAQWSSEEYTIEYELDGGQVETENPTTYTVADEITLNNPTKEGYQFDGWTGTGLNGKTQTVTIQTGSTGNRKYTAHWSPRNNLSYSVEYYYDRKIDDTKTEIFKNQTFGATINTYTIKPITGYEFDKTENLPLTIGTNEEENVIKVYYKKVSNLTYTVNYLDKETNQPIDTAKVVKNQTFGTKVTAESEKKDIDGYTYDSAAPADIIIGMNADENVINLYYNKRTDLSYTVNYYEEGTTNSVQNSVVVEKVAFGTEITAAEKAITIAGYNYKRADKNKITVGTGENVLNLYYEKKTDLSYTVKYLEAETEKELKTAKTVNNRTFGEAYPEKAATIKGYNVVGNAEQSITVVDGENILTFFYTKKNDLAYVVNYLEKNEDGTTTSIQDQKSVGGKTYGDVIEVAKEVIDINGYSYQEADPEKELVIDDSSANVINLYYEKRSNLSYTVNYLEEGTNRALSAPAKVENQTFGTVVTAESYRIPITGYESAGADKESIEVGTEEDQNVLNLYYKKRSDLSYTVEYYYNGKIDASKTKTEYNQTFEAVIKTYEDKVIDGYELDREEGLPLTIGVDATANVIRVYYKPVSNLTYTVNYLEIGTDKVLAEPETVDGQVFGTEISGKSVAAEVFIPGYKFNYSDPSTLIVRTDISRNVLNLYYSKRADMTYTVRYLEVAEEGKEPKELLKPKTVSGCTLGNTYSEYGERISGYKCDALETGNKKSITISANEEENVLTFWYTKRNDLSYKVQYIDQSTGYKIGPKENKYTATFEEKIFSENVKIEIPGYHYVKPDKESIIISTTTKDNLIKLYYEKRSDLSFTVKHYKSDFNEETQKNEFELVTTETYEKQIFDTYISGRNYKKTDIKGYQYDHAEVNGEVKAGFKLGADSSQNVIELYYKKGSYPYGWTQRDIEVPGSVLGSGGVWQGALYGSEISSEKLMKDNNVSDIPGYKFVKANPDPVVIDAVDSFGAKTGNHMDLYYQRRSDMTYTVEYFYDGVKAEDQTIDGKDGVYKDPIPYTADEITTYKDKNYMLKEVVKTGNGTVTLDPAMNIVRVYYVLDDNGPDGKPDEIPDSEEYRVFYDPNGGEGIVKDNAIYPKDYVVTAKENAFTKADSVFAIWEKDGADKVAAGETFVMPERDVTLEAQWKMLTVHKKASAPADGISYKLDEVINFTIDVTNNGDVDLANVEVTDELEGAVIGAGEGYVVSGNVAQIANLSVGSTVTVKAAYTVQETDMGNAEFKNTATATGEGTTGTDTTDPIPMDEVDKQLTVVKELTNLDEATGANGEEKAFALGDTMEFDITVTNTGNQTLSDIEVSDVMEKAQIVAGKGYTVDGNKAIIKELKPEEKITVNAAYEVQEEDLGNPNFQNAATAEAGGTSGGGTSDPISVEEKDPNLSVEKTVINPQEQYQVGDTASYEIVVANTGNVTLENVVVEDILQGTNGEVTFKEVDGVVIDGNVATIESMAPKTIVKLECSYLVTRADAGANLSNRVHVTSDTDETDPKQDTTPTTDVEDIYNLTINYLYEDNSVAATSVHAQYLKGESFGYASPIIDGFTPNFAFVRTGADGMPAEDVTVNVIYTENPVPIVPTPNPETPTDPTPGVVTPDNETTGTPGGAGQTGTPMAQTSPVQGTPEEPVGAEIGVNEGGDVEIVPVIDEEVPLANRELEEHECCMLHFLLMLAAMIVYAFYTRSMKKRQARIAELADQLETELLKRKQGTAE